MTEFMSRNPEELEPAKPETVDGLIFEVERMAEGGKTRREAMGLEKDELATERGNMYLGPNGEKVFVWSETDENIDKTLLPIMGVIKGQYYYEVYANGMVEKHIVPKYTAKPETDVKDLSDEEFEEITGKIEEDQERQEEIALEERRLGINRMSELEVRELLSLLSKCK